MDWTVWGKGRNSVMVNQLGLSVKDVIIQHCISEIIPCSTAEANVYFAKGITDLHLVLVPAMLFQE